MGLLQVSTGSIASSNLDQKSLDSTPAFLQNTGAVMMTDGQMVETRGEGGQIIAGGMLFIIVGSLVIPLVTDYPPAIRWSKTLWEGL